MIIYDANYLATINDLFHFIDVVERINYYLFQILFINQLMELNKRIWVVRDTFWKKGEFIDPDIKMVLYFWPDFYRFIDDSRLYH